MLKLHGVSLTYIQAWRAKEKAVKLVRGDPAESYARLPGNFEYNDKFKHLFILLCINSFMYYLCIRYVFFMYDLGCYFQVISK